MPHAEHRVTIAQPIETVFAYLEDGRNNPRGRRGVLQIEPVTGGPGLGKRYRQVLQGPAGRAIDGDYEVTEHEPPRVLAFRVVAGPARPTGRFVLSPADGGGTEVSFALDLAPAGVARLMGPMIARQMNREVHALDELKRVLETGTSA
ncbi:MAG: hypothetical protein QOC59_676 [Microbacteriaceae bacterium]|nr:hypothetical protein [Microbacteriaceae bacterium]